ncbi:hypothetical protein [Azospirillum sp. sgz302134]
MRKAAAFSALLLAYATPALAAEVTTTGGTPAPGFVAGTAPSMRPADAPSLSAVAKDARWYQKALTGVDAPYPASLKFLDDQGGWYTPFSQPGMTGRYDLRNWHH